MKDRDKALDSSVTARYVTVDPSKFGDEVDAAWNRARPLIDAVKNEVEDGSITPLNGAGHVACIIGREFGYDEFHGPQQQTMALLGLTLDPGLAQATRDRVGATT